jgi:hypothetical protein
MACAHWVAQRFIVHVLARGTGQLYHDMLVEVLKTITTVRSPAVSAPNAFAFLLLVCFNAGVGVLNGSCIVTNGTNQHVT